MSIEAHIASIDEKRTRLKSRIAMESARPAADFALIKELKRENLWLKEEKCRYLDLLHREVA